MTALDKLTLSQLTTPSKCTSQHASRCLRTRLGSRRGRPAAGSRHRAGHGCLIAAPRPDPDRRNEPLYSRVSARITALAQLPRQTHSAELWIGGNTLTQIVEVRRKLARPAGLTRTVSWRLQPTPDVFTRCARTVACRSARLLQNVRSVLENIEAWRPLPEVASGGRRHCGYQITHRDRAALPAKFSFGGIPRTDKPKRVMLHHGDVVVWRGVPRLAYHGVDTLKDGEHPATGRCRINLTFRKTS